MLDVLEPRHNENSCIESAMMQFLQQHGPCKANLIFLHTRLARYAQSKLVGRINALRLKARIRAVGKDEKGSMIWDSVIKDESEGFLTKAFSKEEIEHLQYRRFVRQQALSKNDMRRVN